MLGHALGTAAGIRLANKIDEKEKKKQEKKARNKQESYDNMNTALRLEALRRMRKDLKATVEDVVARDYLDEELTKAFHYLNVDSTFYVSTLRAEIFEVGSWGKLVQGSGVNIASILARVERRKRYEKNTEEVVETSTNNSDTSTNNSETSTNNSETTVTTTVNIDDIHKELLDNLSMAQYKELTKLLMSDLGWSTEVSHDSTASKS